ncbi:outer membrane receptor protein involved in Fe transport [Sphingopyxis panaciterrae]|uniref:TonB-dependent receptor n=1 Tax=Sphingopyxis panaciterrae TaxID=363841 RepID=UPI00142428AD|nr:TonB-dependent receptor [Sphingopyxis panaciterrae]NIJ36671.1 outer membrane receptor protein involved in Fe transport [Sphingopyxis panaciterrae]
MKSKYVTGCALALVWTAPALAQDRDAAGRQQAGQGDDEIIVTATRRETTLQDTPGAVSAIGEEQILKRNLVGMNDYLQSVPGVSFQERGNGQNTITIRGISTGSQISTNTPTGSYFGEVPVTGMGTQINGNQAGNSDPKMFDIERVEVLRGPQGTLFGSGALGGAVRVIPNSPKLTEFEGRVNAEYSNTARRGGDNYTVNAMVNLPIVRDRLAVRLVGYRVFEDGYIDNVAASQPTDAIDYAAGLGVQSRDRGNVGASKTTGFRGSIRWEPVAGLSFEAMHLYQRIEQNGFGYIDTNVSPTDYLQATPRTGPDSTADEFANTTLNLSNFIAEYSWDWGTLINSTSYVDHKAKSHFSLGYVDPASLAGTYSAGRKYNKVFVNETRFTSDWGGPLAVVAGIYYEDRSEHVYANLRYSGTVTTGPAYDDIAASLSEGPERELVTKQFAAFGEAAFTPWDPLTLTVGARYYRFNTSYPIFRDQYVEPVIVNGLQGFKSNVDGVNWKVNLAYKPSDEIFVYGQWAQGFRQPQVQNLLDPLDDPNGDGIVDFVDGTQRSIPPGLLDPDKVDTYEGGFKFQSPSGNVRGSLTGYYTDWKGIPVILLTFPRRAGFYFNAGSATVKGVEFELSGRLPGNWHAQFSMSWSKATLGNDADSLALSGGIRDAQLPGSPNHNAYAALEKQFDIGGNEAFIRGDWTYVSSYYSNLNETGKVGDYHQFGLNAGITIDRIKLGVFAKNLTNRDDFTWVDNLLGGGRAYRLRPRTIGVNVGFDF